MNTRHCRFATREAILAEEWQTLVETTGQWTLGDPVGTGESGSLHITGEGGLCGIAKPAFQGDMPRAAHEKIAADLAHILGVPVPPVILWRNPNGGAPFAISLRAFSQPLTWGQAGHLTARPEFLAGCADILAGGYVFHVWIGDTDHSGNPGNVLIDAASTLEKPALAFIDHAFSMSYSWPGPTPPLQHIGGYYMARENLPQPAVAKAVEWVQDISTEAIERIVKRIPASFLAEDRAAMIVDCLVRRRGQLTDFFGI